MKQTIQLTALPFDYNAGRPRLAVYVTPQLEPDPGAARLDKFETFLNWPKALRKMEFSVRVSGVAGPIAAKRINDPEDALWANLFKPDTPIRSIPDRKYHERMIRSYSVGSVLSHVQGLYRAVAETSMTEHPSYIPKEGDESRNPVIDFVDDVGSIVRREGKEQRGTVGRGKLPTMTRVTDNLYTSERRALDYRSLGASVPASDRKMMDFALAYDFHERPGKRSRKGDPKFEPVKLHEMEFHEIVGAMANYPELLVRLGLVIELELDTTSLPANGRIRVIGKWPSGNPAGNVADPKNPWTVFTNDGKRFQAKPKPASDFRDRMLILDNADDDFRDFSEAKDVRYCITQVDPDGAAMKSMDYARNHFTLRHKNRTYTTPETAALPALKTAGIGVFRFNRSFEVQQHLVAMAAKQAQFRSADPNDVPELYFDDLVRGYRIDVLDDDGKWFSLQLRHGFYHFTKPAPDFDTTKDPVRIEDEGFIRGASATSDLNESQDLYLHESLARWEGWSLAAPRPGKTIVTQEADPSQPVDPNKPYEVPREKLNSSTGVPHVHMDVNFKPIDGTLPRLRFGRRYRVRIRTVDLAGKGLKLEEAPKDPDLVSNEVFYTRFEPVPTPFIVLRDPVAEGESVERMVIRSDYDATTAEYAERVQSKYGKTYATESVRFIAPPKTSQLMAEVHGMFDRWIKEGKIEYAYNVAHKEEGTFLDTTIFDPENPGSPIPVVGLQIVTPPSVPPYDMSPIPDTDPPRPKQPVKIKVLRESDITNAAQQEVWRRGEPLAPGQYIIHKTTELKLPYLPDPFGRGCAFEGLRDGTSAAIDGLTRVELTPPGGGDKRKVLMVPFKLEWPDFSPFTLRIVEREGKMQGNNCDETFAAATQPPTWDGKTLTVYVGKAEIQTVRYSSYITKEDAEQMGIAKWLKGSARRDPALAFAMAGQNWLMTPFRVISLVHAVQHPLCAPSIVKISPSRSIGQTFVQFRGTMLANIASTGRLDMKAEWKDRVDPLDEPGPKQITGAADAFHFDVIDSINNEFQFPGDTLKPLDFFKHDFNDTRYRKVSYHLMGTSRFREYFPETIWADPTNITRHGDAVEVKVKSSARPAAPNVLYILPTFGWDAPVKTGDEIVSRRCGGGLRVYLDRPWYSSGDEELLGVIVPRTPNVAENSPMRPLVTQWGMDPIYAAYPAYNGVQLGHFKSYVGSPGTNLSLDETSVDKVHVVGYQPEYDAERRLWYCDIELDAGPAYTPFIRLALARYQPNSIMNAHLSRVVLADYAQLAPDRSASIAYVGEDMINIFVSGVPAMSVASTMAQSTGSMTPAQRMSITRQMTATLEEQTDPTNPDMGWTPTETREVTLNPHYEQEFGLKMLWQGRMPVPKNAGRPGATKKYRVVIKEWELLESDPHPRAVEISGRPFLRRLVYADAIILQ